MVFIFITSLVITFCLYLIWKNYYCVYKYWELYEIPQPPGSYFIFGHMWPVVLRRLHLMHLVWKWHDQYKNSSMMGFNDAGTPALLIRDPELIKDVLQTKFDCFGENGFKLDRELNPNIYFHPSFNSGYEWVVNRKRMTHAFSQKNLNIIGEHVRLVCGKLQTYLRKEMEFREKLEVDLKSLAAKFTGEVAANTTLGVAGYCFDEENSSVSFYTVVRSIFESETFLGETILLLYPKLSKIFRERTIKLWVVTILEGIVKRIIDKREKQKTPRNNTFLDVVMNLNSTDVDVKKMTSIVVSFLADTYETSHIVASFALFDIANNPDIQEKLREEINTVLSRYPEMGDHITYKAAKELQYMEQVIYESMRIHPAGDLKYRVCTKECDLKGYDGLCCRVKLGTEIFISSFGLQFDPEYWTDPMTFNPDRFAPENIHKTLKFIFMPFGAGPRSCVGMKMGLFVVKSILLTILKEYVLELSPRAKVPVELDPTRIIPIPIGGLWVYLKPISQTF